MKRKEMHGLGLVVVSLALVVALIGAVSCIVLLSGDAFKSSQNEVEPQPPIPAIPPYSSEQALTEEEKSKAIELAINDPEVKKWLEKGYEIYEVVPLGEESSSMCMVYILTEEQKLPWVLGITIGVPVDLTQEEAQGYSINYDLKLASLTDTQKEDVLRIALANSDVLEMIGDKEYEIQDIGVEYWESSSGGKCSFHAYPAVSININPDLRLPGIFAIVYVDLKSEEVVKIVTNPRKSLPPNDGQSTKIIEPTKEVPTMTNIPHLTPQPGECFTYKGNKSKIVLNMDRIPEPGAKDVPVTTPISINFSKLPGIVELEMEPEVEISNINKEFITYPLNGTEMVAIGGGKVTFYLAKPLLPETNYTVKITYGEEEAPPGSRPTSTTMWHFTTSHAIQEPIISVNSTVFEGERWMVIFNDGKVTCYSDHYYPDYIEIVTKEGHISREEIDVLLELFSNLTGYSYTINASEQLIGDPFFSGTRISCIPLNKTLRLQVIPPSFPETETATITAKEIMERIDKIYREAEVSEKRKEINSYLISLNLEPYAPSYQPNQMITFNASLRLVPELKRILYEWDFGNGNKKGYGKIVRHSYSSPGNYTVRLKITSEDVVCIKDKMIATRSTPAPVI
ncbi:MAG: PKD domain-containing protein [Euryarchaeota archaeon]|nr:PKD domain-containing protein [Euryarchaeota archaeon]